MGAQGPDRGRIRDLLNQERSRFARTHPGSGELFERAARFMRNGVPMPFMPEWPGGFPTASESRRTSSDAALRVHHCCRHRSSVAETVGTYVAQRAATSRCRPVPAGYPALDPALNRLDRDVDSRRSDPGYARQAQGSASMHEVPAGVAQQAEQPSCKRQVSGSTPLTGSAPPGCLDALSPAKMRKREGSGLSAAKRSDSKI